jgi:hypothetical protein
MSKPEAFVADPVVPPDSRVATGYGTEQNAGQRIPWIERRSDTQRVNEVTVETSALNGSSVDGWEPGSRPEGVAPTRFRWSRAVWAGVVVLLAAMVGAAYGLSGSSFSTAPSYSSAPADFTAVAARYSLPPLPCVATKVLFFEAPGIDETLYASIEAAPACVAAYVRNVGLNASAIVPVEPLASSELRDLKWHGQCPCTHYDKTVSDELEIRATVARTDPDTDVLVLAVYLD